MYPRLKLSITFNRSRLIGSLTLLVYLAMMVGVPAHYSGQSDCGCQCSQSVKGSGECCCHKPATDIGQSSCCSTAASTAKPKACCQLPTDICAPSDFAMSLLSCCSSATDQPCCSKPAPEKTPAVPEEEHPALTSCGCGGSFPSSLVTNSEPRILSKSAICSSLFDLSWTILDYSGVRPERRQLPETPPPEAA
ncbi:hypothetical protein Pla110_01190 [Polystyrenella longa]|uniref:Uncharacterized protein n=1 Tax=Polystyrenella longa TaxID=2528007 RepID=A0A518CGR5_9PLAN|nr:hypothetical protein [Polystyrenella longa]QDU78418.1 hypothetical protein Pla110_01190 [Polystyrenella longa]